MYSGTITLKPNLYKFPAEEQYDKTYLELYRHLKTLSNKYSMVAELTKPMNIHYHITIELNNKCKNQKKYFIDSFRRHKFFGFVYIKDIYEESKWTEYIGKELVLTKDSIDRPPIICDNFNYFHALDKFGNNFFQYDLNDEQ